MTVAGPRQNNPRLRPPSPRRGVYRRRGASTPVNAVVASGATAWLDGHDGSGLQVVNSRIGVATYTLGSTTGVDTNDPTWGSNGWTFDITDDFISSTADAPNVTATTGKHTAIVAITLPFYSNGVAWGSGASINQRLMIFQPAANQFNVQFRGASAVINSTAQTFPSVVAGTKTIVGFVIDTGTIRTYMYQGSTGSLSVTTSIATAGTYTATAPRYGNYSYTTGGSFNGTILAAVEWKDLALDQTTLDTVSAYLLGTF